MFIRKFNSLLLVLSLFFVTQCYKAPFFELTVKIMDQNFNSVKDVSIKIVAADVDSDDLDVISNSNLTDLDGQELECITGASGECEFSFENKAFITIQACFDSGDDFMCQEAFVYLKEDENVLRELMLVDVDMNTYNCSYCPL